jgi:hypothetical protein
MKSRPTLGKVVKTGLSGSNVTQDPENHVLGPRPQEKLRLRGSRLKLGEVVKSRPTLRKVMKTGLNSSNITQDPKNHVFRFSTARKTKITWSRPMLRNEKLSDPFLSLIVMSH